MLFLPSCCRAVTTLATGGSKHYALSCVRVRQAPGARFRVEATDGRVLGIVHGRSAPTPADLEAARDLPRPEVLALEALVPAGVLRKAFRALPGDRSLGVLLGDPVLLAAGETVSRCAADPGRYPDVEGVLAKAPALVSIRVDPDLLITLLKTAAAVSQAGDRPGVELLWWGPDKPLGVTAQGAGGVFFDGLLMPMT
ncbi:MAG: hypothetical protein U0797_26225 [Gemmataceae bacterium]